jgi:hypothetical protein
MDQKEFEKKFPEICVKVNGINNKEALYKFILEKMNT